MSTFLAVSSSGSAMTNGETIIFFSDSITQGAESLEGLDSLKDSSLSVGWQVDWPEGTPTTISDKTTPDDVLTAINNAPGPQKNVKITSTFAGGSASSLISARNTGDSYLDLAGTWVNTSTNPSKYVNLISGGTNAGNLYFKVSEGGSITTGTAAAPGTVYEGALIGVNNCDYTGDFSMEFDSSKLTIEGRTVVPGPASSAAIISGWGNKNLIGSSTLVFKKGTFGFSGNTGTQGMILGGLYSGGSSSGAVTKGTFIEISGGTFYGAIIGGGHMGDVATGGEGFGTNILINGGTISGDVYGGSISSGNVGTSAFANGTNIRIDGALISTSNPLAISGNIYGASKDAGIVYGDTNITLSNFDQAKLASLAAGTSLNGGSQGAGSVSGSKILTLDKVTGDVANALNNFDSIVVKEGTDVGLTHADGVNALRNVQFSGAGSLALKTVGTYQYALGHTGAVGSIDASKDGVISNIILGKANVADAISMNTLKLSTGALAFDIGSGVSAEKIDTLAVAVMTSTGQIGIAINAREALLAPGTYDLISGDLSGVHSFVLSTPSISSRQQWALKQADGKLSLEVTGEGSKSITWNGGATGIWQHDGENSWTDGTEDVAFANGDTVTFTTIDGQANSLISLVGELDPSSITVSGDTNYTWQGLGSLSGAGALDKSGNGNLVIATNNSGYTGDVTIRGGVLEMGHANALGTGKIAIQGGTLKYGTGIVADISSRLEDGSASSQINIDLNGNAETWGTWKNFLNLTNTAQKEGILTLTANAANLTASLGENAALKVTSANNSDVKGSSVSLSGAGKFIVANTNGSRMGVGNITGFTGEIIREQTNGSASLMLTSSNTANDRFDLTINGSANNQAVVLGTNSGFAEGSTLYLRNLSGTSSMTTSYNGNKNRSLNMEMTRDNEYSGNFHTATVNTDLRWGTVTVGSKAGGDTHSFKWSGFSLAGTSYGTLGTNAKMIINNAVVDFTSNADKTNHGGWYDDILINAGGTLRVSRTDATGFVHNQGISGAGNIVIAGNATFNAANTLTGNIAIESGTLTIGNVGALGAGNVSLAGGTLNVNVQALAKALTVDAGKVSTLAGASAYAGALTLNGGLRMGVGAATETMSVTSLTTGATSSFFFNVDGANSDKIVVNQNGVLNFAAGTKVFLELATTPTAGTTYDLLDATASGITFTGKENFVVSDSTLVRGFTATGVWGGTNNNVYKVTISGTASAGTVSWNGGDNGVWAIGGNGWTGKAGDGTTDVTDFRNGDHVTFTTLAGKPESTVTLQGTLLPADVTVSGSTNYTFSGTGVIGGTTTLVKDGTGKLVISTINTYSGQTTIKGGILEMGNASALGTGAIAFEGGTLRYGAGVTSDLSSRIAEGTAANRIRIDLNGNEVAWATRRDFLDLSNTNASKAGVLTLNANPTNMNVVVGANATLNVTVANGKTVAGDSVTLRGAGKFIVSNTDEVIMGIGSMAGFTGELVRNQSNTGANASLMLTSSNTAADRFDLTINGSSNAQALIMGNNGSFTAGGSLHLRNLNGNGNITTSFNNVANRCLNIEMTKNNAYSGSFHTANTGGTDVRWGTLTIGSYGGDVHSFVWTGQTLAGSAYGTLGTSARMEINNAIVDVASNADKTKNGAWYDEILINEGGTLRVSRTDATGFVHNQGISGVGNIVIAGNATFNAANALTGSLTIESGMLTVGHVGALGDGKVVVAGGTLNLNNMQVNKTLTVTSGALSNGGAFTGRVEIDQSTATAASNVNMGGVLGGRFSSVKSFVDVAGDLATTVSNIGSGTVSLSGSQVLGITSNMISTSQSNSNSVLRFADGATGGMAINGALTLALTDASATALINGMGSTQYISLINGTLSIGQNGKVNVQSPYHVFQNIFNFNNASGGSLVLNAKDPAKSGWVIVSSTDTPLSIDSKSVAAINAAKGIYNDGTLTLAESAGDVTLKNLEGASANGVINTVAGKTLTLTNDGITSSVYHGSISGGADLIKGGTDYAMTIGKLNLTGGASLTVDGGSLTISTGGAGSTSLIDGDLILANSGLFTLGANHILTINGEIDAQAPLAEAAITLQENSVLKLGTGFELGADITGKGTLNILTGEFSLGADAILGDELTLALDRDATARMKEGDSVGALSGNGTLNLDGGTLELKNATGSFSGTFTGANGTLNHSGTGTQTIVSAGNQTLSINQSGTGKTVLEYEAGTAQYDNVTATAGTMEIIGSISAQSAEIGTGVHLVIGRDPVGVKAAGGSIFSSSSTTLAGGSQITLNGITSETIGDTSFHAGTVTHTGDSATTFNLSTRGDWTNASYTINLMDGTNIDASDYEAILKGALKNLGYTISSIVNQDGTLKALIQSSGANGLLELANSHNTVEAANSLWYSRVENPAEDGILRSIIDTLINSGSGKEGDLTTKQATQALASYAGSSVTSLFSAQRDSLYQQVKWIRNRTTQMGVNPDYVNEDMPYFNAWIQGNGGYNRIDQQGDQAGYTLDTWGGTAGVDVDLSEKLTVGAAFTASYNKIRTNSYDHANGRDDAYYVNLFARLQHKKWSHTLIVTGGTNDATLNRTVSIGDAQYHTNGSTTGSSIGAFYEGTYDVVLNQKGTSIFQPLINASVYRSQMDGYTETGMGDASMKVNERDATYGRVGLGARLMGIVGSNVLGRGALGEVRMQIVQDYGDETHTATLSPLGALNRGLMNVRGAKVGRTGAQIGAGLSLPVGEKGSIYADVDAEFRSRATVLSGNLGYRINF